MVAQVFFVPIKLLLCKTQPVQTHSYKLLVFCFWWSHQRRWVYYASVSVLWFLAHGIYKFKVFCWLHFYNSCRTCISKISSINLVLIYKFTWLLYTYEHILEKPYVIKHAPSSFYTPFNLQISFFPADWLPPGLC